MGLTPLRERRARATRTFVARVFLLIATIGLIAYSVWFAPRSLRSKPVQIEIAR
jgi:hypothetical protein